MDGVEAGEEADGAGGCIVKRRGGRSGRLGLYVWMGVQGAAMGLLSGPRRRARKTSAFLTARRETRGTR